jgi:hypothetical protein
MKKILLIILLLLSGICYSANEIRVYYQSDYTLFATIRNTSGQAWDVNSNSFESWNVMADYNIPMVDKSGGLYLGDFDPNITAGYYYIITFLQDGNTPNDTNDTPILYEEGYWTGTIWYSDPKQLQTIRTNLGYVDTDIQSILGNQTVINNNITDSNSTIMAELADVNDNIETNLAIIIADTNEIQTDWTNGGRLDTILDDIKSYILKLLDRIF